ncbi:MAG: hypothetical protein WBC07_03610 [Methylotenera sp.]
MMTREDRLRELELLPMWLLRVPLAEKLEPVTLAKSEVTTNRVQQIDVKDVTINAPSTEIIADDVEAIAPQVFSHVVSEDGLWLFVLPNAEQSAEEAQLLQNIYKAMRIKPKIAVVTASTAEIINANHTKLVITMGEATAQAMLQSTETLDHLRGKLHLFEGVKLVATYHAGHLLENLSDKAKAWQDLCFAMQAIQDL